MAVNRVLTGTLAILTASCGSLSFPPGDEEKKQLLSATFDEIEKSSYNVQERGFDRKKLRQDCCRIYSGFGENKISDIEPGWTTADHIVFISWTHKREHHFVEATFDRSRRIVEFQGM